MWRSRWDSLPVRDAWPRCAAHCERIWQHRPYATGLRSPARLRPHFAKCGTDGVKPKECLRDDPRHSGSASLPTWLMISFYVARFIVAKTGSATSREIVLHPDHTIE